MITTNPNPVKCYKSYIDIVVCDTAVSMSVSIGIETFEIDTNKLKMGTKAIIRMISLTAT